MLNKLIVPLLLFISFLSCSQILFPECMCIGLLYFPFERFLAAMSVMDTEALSVHCGGCGLSVVHQRSVTIELFFR